MATWSLHFRSSQGDNQPPATTIWGAISEDSSPTPRGEGFERILVNDLGWSTGKIECYIGRRGINAISLSVAGRETTGVENAKEVFMNPKRKFIWILALAALWGAAELFGEGLLAELGIGEPTIWLAVVAILLLSLSRGIWNRAGSSSIIGLVAAGMKFAGPSPFVCQLLGIVCIGLIFDLFASTLLRDGGVEWWRGSLVGLLTAFGARTVFVLYATHVVHLQRWVEGGSTMALEHVLLHGTVVAFLAMILVPLGLRAGRRLSGRAPSAVTTGANPVCEDGNVG